MSIFFEKQENIRRYSYNKFTGDINVENF